MTAVLVITGCSADEPSVTGVSGGAATTSGPQATYPISEAGFEQCLTDSGVPFRKKADGSLETVGGGDTAIAQQTERCSTLTTKPATKALNDYTNAVTRRIVTCLQDEGFAVVLNASDEDGMSDAAGREQLTFRVPEALRDDPAYRAADESCVKAAEAAVPSPPS